MMLQPHRFKAVASITGGVATEHIMNSGTIPIVETASISREEPVQPPPPSPGRRVVAVVLNPFINDTRVLKQARSLRSVGHEVHVVAVWKPGLPFEEEFDGILVHRVRLSPVGMTQLPRYFWTRNRSRLKERLLARSIAWQDPDSPAEEEDANGIDRVESDSGTGEEAANRLAPWWRIKGMWRVRRQLLRIRRQVLRIRRQVLRIISACRRLPGRLAALPRSIIHGFRPTAAPKILYPSLQMGMNLDLAGRVASLDPDVVHCHDLNTLVAGMLASRIRDVPVVYDSHELFLERNLAGRSRFWDKLQWGFIERRFIGKCAAVSTVAEGIARHLEKQYDLDKVELIRNVQPFVPPAGKSHLLADELGIARDRRIALYAGAITQHRGLETLIEASSLFGEDIACVIMGYAGRPEYLEKLEDLAARTGVLGRNLFFRDAVPPDDVNEYAASADIAVVPTEAICLSYEFEASNKIFHSVMARVPVAMSDHIEKRLVNERHGIGILFDEQDPGDVANRVRAFLDDRKAYEAAVRACGEAAKVLNWEHEERTLLAMFDRVVRESCDR